MYKLILKVFGRFLPKARKKIGETKPRISSKTLKSDWLYGELFSEINLFVRTQRSRHTSRAYAKDIEQFIKFSRQNGGPLNLELLLAFKDYLVLERDKGGLGLSHASANRKFSSLRAFLDWLEQRGKIRENPSQWVKNFRAKKESSTQDFSDQEVAKVLELPNERSRSGLMHSLILEMLFFLGLRRSELVALKASDLMRVRVGEDTVLAVKVPGKGDKERLLPLTQSLENKLMTYLNRENILLGDDAYLFRAVRNNINRAKLGPITPHAVYYMVKKYAGLAGVERSVSPHSCRATCISNALDQGATHRAVQDLAGWSSPLMLERYDKRRTGLKNSAVHLVKYK